MSTPWRTYLRRTSIAAAASAWLKCRLQCAIAVPFGFHRGFAPGSQRALSANTIGVGLRKATATTRRSLSLIWPNVGAHPQDTAHRKRAFRTAFCIVANGRELGCGSATSPATLASFCNLAGPRSDPVPKRQSNRGAICQNEPIRIRIHLSQPAPLTAFSSAFSQAHQRFTRQGIWRRPAIS